MKVFIATVASEVLRIPVSCNYAFLAIHLIHSQNSSSFCKLDTRAVSCMSVAANSGCILSFLGPCTHAAAAEPQASSAMTLHTRAEQMCSTTGVSSNYIF